MVQTMDGEEFRISFSKMYGCFSGMHRLFIKLGAKQLQFLTFKYLGGQKFEVYLLDTNYLMQATPGMKLFCVHYQHKIFLVLMHVECYECRNAFAF